MFKLGDIVEITGPSKFGRRYNIGKTAKISEVYKNGAYGVDVIGEPGIGGVQTSDTLQLMNTSKTASIIYEKLVIDGVKCVKILELKNFLSASQLPSEYLTETPRIVYFTDNMSRFGMHTVKNGVPVWEYGKHSDKVIGGISTYWSNVMIGDKILCFEEEAIFTEEDFKKIVAHMKECGERLAKINLEIKEKKQKEDAEKKLKASWHGIHEVTI